MQPVGDQKHKFMFATNTEERHIDTLNTDTLDNLDTIATIDTLDTIETRDGCHSSFQTLMTDLLT